MMRMWAKLALGLLVTSLLATACGAGSDSVSSSAADRAVSGVEPVDWSAVALAKNHQGLLVPQLVNSSLGVGSNRVMFVLVEEDGSTLTDEEVDANLFRFETVGKTDEVTGVTAVGELVVHSRTLVPSVDHVHDTGEVHVHSGSETGFFVTEVNFAQAGWWGAELYVGGAQDAADPLRVKFFVGEQTREPMIGDPVPLSRQLVLADVDDISEVDTALPPNPAFHDLTVAEAVAAEKPFVVAFVTPAFCQTSFCGPVLKDAVAPMAELFGDQIAILHIEPFDLEAVKQGSLVAVETVDEWGLVTEPWVFVVDSDGTVAAKFEGIVEATEIAEAIDQLLP